MDGLDVVPPASPEPTSQVLDAALVRESLDALQESFFILDAVRDDQGDVVDFRYRFMNAAAERLHGRPAMEVLGQYLLDLFPSVVSLGIFECVAEPLRTGRPSSLRVPAFDENGVAGAFDIAAARFGDGAVVTARDITAEVAAQRELAESEALLRLVLDSTSDVIMRFGPDLRVEYVNRRMVELSGISLDDWMGKTAAEMGYPREMTDVWEENIRRVFATGETLLDEGEGGLPGALFWFESRLDPEFDADGSVGHVITTSRDVSERKQAEARLRDSEALLAVAVEGSRDGTVTYGPDMLIEYVNRRAVELSGIPAEAWIGRSMEELGYPESSVAFWTARIQSVFATGLPQMMEYEVDNTEGHGWYEANLSPVLGPDGSVAHVVSTNRDITGRVVAEESLRELATHDPLTGLANRAVLLDDIRRGINDARRTGSSTAVLLIDLDRFKNVNDSLGHDAGDTLLMAAAQRLAGTVRGGDLVGRMGGDEFVVVMRNLAGSAEAVRAAWRLVEALRSPFSTPVGELFSTASIGVAVARAGGTPADLLRDADTAMYAAKEAGRDRVAVFNDELRDAVSARLAIEGHLRHALERSELAVWYQPEVDLVTGRIIAAEALLRWHHPSGETLTAARFIDVAEDTGLILDIGDWVIAQACAQAATWTPAAQENPITVRVNVSARQLAEAGLLPALDAALATSGLDPGRLCLEITETALLGETTIARENIAGIHERGVRIAIDDFGTGYASLTYLHRYPIDVLKVDRSFIASITSDGRDYRLVGALIAMANHLELAVTAEGVEHEEQADRLRALGCLSAQGYLYSKAIPPQQMSTMLDTVFPHP